MSPAFSVHVLQEVAYGHLANEAQELGLPEVSRCTREAQA